MIIGLIIIYLLISLILLMATYNDYIIRKGYYGGEEYIKELKLSFIFFLIGLLPIYKFIRLTIFIIKL